MSKQWFRYTLATFAVIIISTLLAVLLEQFLKTAVVTAIIAVFAVGISYTINKLFVFKNTNRDYVHIIAQLLLFAGIFILNALLSVIVLALLPSSVIVVSLLFISILMTVLNFFLYKQVFEKVSAKKVSTLAKVLKSKTTLKIIAINLALTIPIFAFSLGLLQSGQKIIPGDPDYYFQIYEAFRRSLLDFHQLPFWNGWVGGGIPLFANIQFGLISVQAPFVLLFGTIFGMKLAIVAYQLIAFFGFRKLFLVGFKSSPIKATLLAYIPVFGSFFVDRIVAGHFTFLLIAFVPWLILFFITRSKKLSWLYFAITYSIMVWSSPHYVTIMALVLIGIWFLYETIYQLIQAWQKNKFKDFKTKLRFDMTFFIKAGLAILLLCFYRMFFVVDFIRDFPRETGLAHENFTGFFTGLYAIWGPDQYASPPLLSSGWGWAEAAAYIGIGTLVCIMLIFGVFIYNTIKKRPTVFTYSPIILGVLLVSLFVLGMGNFGPASPYTILSNLPVFDSMRVATRWLMWTSLFVLFIIAAYKGKIFTKTINVILFITVIELFISGSNVLSKSYFVDTLQYRPSTATFEQAYGQNLPRSNYSSDPKYLVNYWYDENLYETTRNNLGQVIAGDSLVDTRQPNTTIRCGANQPNCKFVSDNAKVVYWSPDRIILQRTSTGPIVLNSNPGKGWLVNGQYEFLDEKITNPLKAMVIENPSDTITLEYAPKLSPLWLKTSLKNSV